MKLKDLLKLMSATDRISIRVQTHCFVEFEGCCCDFRATALDENHLNDLLNSAIASIYLNYDYAPCLRIVVKKKGE